MPPSAPSQNGSEAVLAEVVEEFTRRVQASEPVDVESYVQRYPEHAERLRRLLPALALLDDLGRSSSASAADGLADSHEGSLAGVLGDFRIVREVGKGGMGVVYEAEQLSLRRRVALKVLPFAATMDPRQLQRFHNEAQAAACLHHTNIVPVFSVGSERGVHFYAMQFIDGQPLSELIRQLHGLEQGIPTPQPTAEVTPLMSTGGRGRDYFRQVAELGVQAAEALDYAHQLGIVHRDIKPANLLLDGAGRLWVTDFGLAHMQQSEASLTLTGQTVGTPRYMSPEQALAKRVPIDHRTDVYSLGATLYELLTLRPAFGSENRQELLRQIAFEDPIWPRRLERAVPAELEIIVLKAMEKRPQDRYVTAQELADDLRHWLEDRPIRARRPTLLQRGCTWARRRRAVVASAGLYLLFMLIILGAAGGWILRDQGSRKEAAERQARDALTEALRWQREQKWYEGLEALKWAEGLLSQAGDGTSLGQQARELRSDLEMASRLEEVGLRLEGEKDDPADWTEADRAYAQAFQDYGLNVLELDPRQAGARIRQSLICMQLVAALDDWAAARQRLHASGWQHVLAIARAADPDRWRNRLRDALEKKQPKAGEEIIASLSSKDCLPSTFALLARIPHGEADGERVVLLLRQARRRFPGDLRITHSLAAILRHLPAPGLEESIRYYTIAVSLRPQSPAVHYNLGEALQQKGDIDEAVAEYRESVRLDNDYILAHNRLRNVLLDKPAVEGEPSLPSPKAIPLKMTLPLVHGNGDAALLENGSLDAAIAGYRHVLRLRKDDAVTHYNLGNALQKKAQLDAAIAAYREAIRLQFDFPEAHCNLGSALTRKGQFREAVSEFRRGHELGIRRARWAYSSVGWRYQAEQLARLDEQLSAVRKSEAPPKGIGNRLDLALCHFYRQRYVAAARLYAAELAARSTSIDRPPAFRYNAACAAALAGCGRGEDAKELDATERARLRQQALDWLWDDLKWWRQALDDNPNRRPATEQQTQPCAQLLPYWLLDDTLLDVRSPEGLARLPHEERRQWEKLWQEVEQLRQREAGRPAIASLPPPP